MITKASKCQPEILEETAAIIRRNEDYSTANFAHCKTQMEVAKELKSSDSWCVLIDTRPTALFRLETFDSEARISEICLNSDTSLEKILSDIRQDLAKMRIAQVAVRTSSGDAQMLAAVGFEMDDSYVRFSRVPTESKMMPILPLLNATQKEVPILSRMMCDAYKKTDPTIGDSQSAERMLRSIMFGSQGRYLAEASFSSGAFPNLVSACLLTANSAAEARIAQLFTHPLYRARGLATTAIAIGMNRLASSGVVRLVGWSRENNDVLRRLLTKMGFNADRKLVEMVARI